MSEPDGKAQQDWVEGGPERLYVVTMGRSQPSERVPLDLVALIVSRSDPALGMHPEQAAILRMCTSPLSIAEISAYLSLPASTVTILAADLADSGHAEVRMPASTGGRPKTALLEAVIDGLSKL